jgi:hypothetical protein
MRALSVSLAAWKKRALVFGLPTVLFIGQTVWAADFTNSIGYPSGSTSIGDPLYIFFPTPGNGAATVRVGVPNIKAIKPAAANGVATAQEMSDAAVAKANAIAAAVNNSASAQKKNISASVGPLITVKLQQYGAPPGTLIEVKIPEITYTSPGKPYAYKGASAKLGEMGDGQNIKKSDDKGGMSPTPSYLPGGKTSIDNGMNYDATGVDGSGNPSFAGFGFYDTSLSNPTYYYVDVAPTAGETAYAVLQTLADEFNTDYTPDGYTASFNTLTGAMTINQGLNPDDLEYSTNNDTGLYFTLTNTPLPAPLTGALVLMSGLYFFRRGVMKIVAG